MSDQTYKKYITYFQSVTTIGILTCAENADKAEKEAIARYKISDLNYCHFEQTPMEVSDTVEWNPDFEIISEDPTKDGKEIEWTVKLGNVVMDIVSTRYGVTKDEITEKHVSVFVKEALENIVASHHE